MLVNLSLFGIGFSIFAAAILFFAYVVFFKNVNKSWLAVASCAVLLSSLSGLQYGHSQFLLTNTELFSLPSYRFLLFLVPPMFYFFSRAILLPGQRNSPVLLVHLTPLLLNFIDRYEIAVPLIFVVGTGYSFWFASLIYNLRTQRKRFMVEMFFFGFFAVLAVLVLVMGFLIPYMDNSYFYLFYMNSITFAFLLIVTALLIFPDLLNEIAVVATLSYATSTLKDVDVDDRIKRLDDLMQSKKIYQNENLSLAMLAELMELSSHQLSELINVHFGMSFSRYIREQRVAAARLLLASEQEASILSISLDTGFKSQSNFYAAFREITGMSPGDYRKSLSR
jgi:AraC-like DNA-binding protein